MRVADIFVDGRLAGQLEELDLKKGYCVRYLPDYKGQPISLTLPQQELLYEFDFFPPFFEGLLPEGIQLEALLKNNKIDRYDLFSQIIAVGHDLVGCVQVQMRESV